MEEHTSVHHGQFALNDFVIQVGFGSISLFRGNFRKFLFLLGFVFLFK